MGKYMNELEGLVNLRQGNNAVLNGYGYLMDDVGKSYHTAKAGYYDEQIYRILPMVLDEMMEEVAKQFDVKVKDEATPALRQLNEELRRLGK